MYEDFAWKQFIRTGNVETFVEYKKLASQLNEEKGDIVDETNKSERNCDKRSNI